MNKFVIKNDINILQWNCRSINNKLATLCKLIEMHKIDVVLLTETFLSKEKSIKINGFNVIRYDRNSRGGGVMIAIKNIWKYKNLNFENRHDQIEVIGCKVELNKNEHIDIMSIYINHKIKLNIRNLNNIFSKLSNKFIVGGDFNAHAIEWGCANNSQRGELISEYMDRKNIVILNDGSFTRLNQPQNASSAIDLTLVDAATALKCCWKTTNASCGSDHLPVITNMILNNPKKIMTASTIISQKKVRNYMNNEEWVREKFQNKMTIERFMEIMHELIKNCETEIKQRQFNVKKPWWNNECSKALALSFQATKNYRTHGNQENYEIMIKNGSELKKTSRKAKKEGWFNFCSSVTHDTSLSEIWKMAKIFKGNDKQTFIHEDCKEWIEDFMDKHSQPAPCNQIDFNNFHLNKENEFLNEKIEVTLVKEKIQSLKKSASGIDKINNNILKQLPEMALERLTECFNTIISDGKIPEEWKTCKVIALQKPNKPTNMASSKRPISIFGKTRRLFESCFLKDFERWAEISEKYSPSQYGFRKGRSTRDCIAILISDVKIAFEEKKLVGAIFLDVEAAYDNINIETFVKQMNLAGAPRNVCQLLWSMYSKKINKYVVNNTEQGERTSTIGFPQGLPTSPTSFNLAISKIDECLEEGVKNLQFADDDTIYCAGKDSKEIEDKLNRTLKSMMAMMSKIGLNYSAEKTKSMVFSRKHQDTRINIEVNRQIVEQVESFKLLGVTLTRKLNFNQHMKNMAAAGAKTINVMRSVAGTKWGVDPRCLDMLYKGCVRSKLEYCSFVYPENKCIQMLERVQWKACRIISGCMQSTHTQSLEVITGILPLRLRFQQIKNNFYNSVFSHKHELRERLEKLNRIGTELLARENPETYQYDNFPFYRKVDWKTKCIKDIKKLKIEGRKENCSSESIIQKFLELKQNFQDNELIYCDGSKQENRTSFGIYHENGNLRSCQQKVRISGNNISIFVAEAMAILTALRHVRDNHDDKKKICIITDSLSVLQALKKKKNDHKRHFVIGKILDLTEELSENSIEISFLWVPSHCGIEGNEIADKLAQDGIEAPDRTQTITLHSSELPATQMVARLEKWQQCWNESDKGRLCYSILTNVKMSAWFKETNWNRQEIVFWNRVIANHTRSKDSLNRNGILNTAICECGQNYQTVNHLIFECSLTEARSMKNYLCEIGFHPPWNIRDIVASEIKNKKKPAMEIIAHFMAKKLIQKKMI